MDTAAITFPIFGDNFILNPQNYVLLFGVRIYWYGILIAFGFLLAALFLLRTCESLGLSRDNILDLVIVAVPSGLIGARIYYVVFNAQDYFGSGKWLDIFKFREGGLAVYGGIIFTAAAVLVYSRVKKIPFPRLCDAGGLGLLIGQAIGRWGNFFNREAFGAETTVPWRMGLIQDGSALYVHPTFFYESVWNVLGFIFILITKKHKKYDGQLFLMYIAWYGFGRYVIEGLRSDSLFLGGTDIRVSQLLAALSFSVSIIILLRNHLKGKTSEKITPGEISVPAETETSQD